MTVMRIALLVTLLLSTGCAINHQGHRSLVCNEDDGSTRCFDSGASPRVVDFAAGGRERRLDCETDRDRLAWMPNPCVKSASAANYRLAIVEFDDYGDLWFPAQYDRARKMLDELQDRQILLFVFIHGWKHNAAAGDSNLEAFTRIIGDMADNPALCELIRDVGAKGSTEFSKSKAVQDAPRRCGVMGVYIAWRGDSLGLGQVKNLTVFNRKAAARVASGIPSTEVITQLLARLAGNDRQRLLAVPTSPADGEAATLTLQETFDRYRLGASSQLLVGHSFGARFLESAMAQALLGRMETLSRIGLVPRVEQLSATVVGQSSRTADHLDDLDRAGRMIDVLVNQATASRNVMLENRSREKREIGKKDEALKALEKVATAPDVGRDLLRLRDAWNERGRASLEAGLKGLAECRQAETEPDGLARIQQLEDAAKALQARAQAFAAFASTYDPAVQFPPTLKAQFEACAELQIPVVPNVARAQFAELIAAFESFEAAVAGQLPEVPMLSFCSAGTGALDDLVGDSRSGIDRKYIRDLPLAEVDLALWQWRGDVEKKAAHVCSSAMRSSEYAAEAREATGRLCAALDQARITVARSSAALRRFEHDDIVLRRSIEGTLWDTVETIHPPADLALMVNAATEGLRGVQLAEALAEWPPLAWYFGEAVKPTPILVQLSSKQDGATLTWFPRVQRVEEVLTRSAPGREDGPRRGEAPWALRVRDKTRQRTLLRSPLAQIDDAWTHVVDTGIDQFDAKHHHFATAFDQALSTKQNEWPCLSVNHPAGAISVRPLTPGTMPCKDMPITRSPVWAIQTSRPLIGDHNDIFGPGFGALAGLLLSSTDPLHQACRSTANDTCGATRPGEGEICSIMRQSDCASSSLGDMRDRIRALQASVDVAHRSIGGACDR